VIFHHLQCDNPILKVFQHGGWVGVDLFFVLSGLVGFPCGSRRGIERGM
jgi:peptidoglycan/LPS O-acetylase OafA/YrhL